jgi:hypothetical protein
MASGDKLKVFWAEFSTFSVAVSSLCPSSTVVEPLTHSHRIEGLNPSYNTGWEKNDNLFGLFCCCSACIACTEIELHYLHTGTHSELKTQPEQLALSSGTTTLSIMAFTRMTLSQMTFSISIYKTRHSA